MKSMKTQSKDKVHVFLKLAQTMVSGDLPQNLSSTYSSLPCIFNQAFYHHRRMLKCFYFFIFCSQIWLCCLVHDHHYNPQVNYIGFQQVVNNIKGCLSVFSFLYFIAKFGDVVLCMITIVITSKTGKNKKNNNQCLCNLSKSPIFKKMNIFNFLIYT